MAAYLAPVEKPRGLMLKMIYFFTRRQFGKVMGPITVFAARAPPRGGRLLRAGVRVWLLHS